MEKKVAFVYAHGGVVFDNKSQDGLNERGRNLVKSIKSAISSGGEMIFISESVYPGVSGQVNILIKNGYFTGFKDKMNVVEYPVEEGVPFPKNYLFNRGAQRANEFFGLVFSDSDVIYPIGFPQRALKILEKYEFAQPDSVIYLDPQGLQERQEPFSMKMFNTNPHNRSSITYVQGMPGMVNIVRRNAFLSIGGFTQAISGVNYEDMEYTMRLKMMGKPLGFINGENVYHLFHSRKTSVRKSEGLPTMHAENLNFMCWWVSSYMKISIPGNQFDREMFKRYLEIVKLSLESNDRFHGPYRNRTGALMPGFNPHQRYRGYLFGLAEPYSESEPKDVQCVAIIEASSFWRISIKEVLIINKGWYHRSYTIDENDVYDYQRRHGGKKEEQNKPEEDMDRFFDEVLSQEEDTDEAFDEALKDEPDENLDSEFERILNE